MIERQGDKVVAYLKDDFTPTLQAEATLVKVTYDDGRILFLVPKEQESDEPPNATEQE